VALVRGERTITDVARDLGVSKWSLGHWVWQAEEGGRQGDGARVTEGDAASVWASARGL
jgi:transposase-like protein